MLEAVDVQVMLMITSAHFCSPGSGCIDSMNDIKHKKYDFLIHICGHHSRSHFSKTSAARCTAEQYTAPLTDGPVMGCEYAYWILNISMSHAHLLVLLYLIVSSELGLRCPLIRYARTIGSTPHVSILDNA